jgi:hypothetical protein
VGNIHQNKTGKLSTFGKFAACGLMVIALTVAEPKTQAAEDAVTIATPVVQIPQTRAEEIQRLREIASNTQNQMNSARSNLAAQRARSNSNNAGSVSQSPGVDTERTANNLQQRMHQLRIQIDRIYAFARSIGGVQNLPRSERQVLQNLKTELNRLDRQLSSLRRSQGQATPLRELSIWRPNYIVINPNQ